MSIDRFPQTDSIQELARFWDTHELTDYEDDVEEVTEPVFERRTVVRIDLPPEEIEAVQKLATSKGVECADLIREWVREKVRAP